MTECVACGKRLILAKRTDRQTEKHEMLCMQIACMTPEHEVGCGGLLLSPVARVLFLCSCQSVIVQVMGSLRCSLFRSPVEKTERKVQRELITGGFTLTLPLTGVRGRTAVRQTRSKRSVTDNHSQPLDLCSSVS